MPAGEDAVSVGSAWGNWSSQSGSSSVLVVGSSTMLITPAMLRAKESTIVASKFPVQSRNCPPIRAPVHLKY